MGQAEEYRRNAEDAERRGERALNDMEREAYEKIARGWRDLLAAAENPGKRGG